MRKLMMLLLILPLMSTAQTIPGSDATIGEEYMLTTVWLRPGVEFHANSCTTYGAGAKRCYMQDSNKVYMLEWDEATQSWVQKDDADKTMEYEDPTKTSCGPLGLMCNEYGWYGKQWHTLRPWMSPFGGCQTTVWGCNPTN